MISLKKIINEVNYMGISTEELLDKVFQFKDKTLIFFDTETMGLNPNKVYSQLLEIGIIVVDGSTMTDVESHNIKIKIGENVTNLFKPDSVERKEWDKKVGEKRFKTPDEILSMTHYLENKSAIEMSESEALNKLNDIILKYPSPILLAHNATFDMRFINTRALQSNINLKRVPVIDTLRISQLYFIPILQAIKSKLISDLKFTKTMFVKDIKPKDPNKPKYIPPQTSTEFSKSIDPASGEELLTIKTGYPSSSLGKLAVALFKKVENWHDALSDTKTMIEVFKTIIEYLKLHKDLDIRQNKELAYRTIKRREKKYANENLELMRYKDELVVKSDNPDKVAASKETFKNKNALRDAGFRWDAAIGLWKINASKLSTAQKVLDGINKIEKFVDRIEDLQEFVYGIDGDVTKKDELGMKIENFISELATSVDEVAASKLIKDYLSFNAKFTSYSQYNTILIYLQNKTATKLSGFRAWEDKFGRRVKKGAKGISILAPIISGKSKEDVTVTNDSGLDKAVERKTLHGFKVVNVFDIADTEPIPGKEKEIPKFDWHAGDEPNEIADKLIGYVGQVADNLNISVSSDIARGGEMGYAKGDHINISSGVAGVNKAGTLIHELAHELLHFNKKSLFYIGDDSNAPITKATEELQAEAVSYVVLRHYDLPAEHQSNYLALFKTNSQAIKGNLNVIKKAADFIIKEIDKVAAAEPLNEDMGFGVGFGATMNLQDIARHNKKLGKLKKVLAKQGDKMIEYPKLDKTVFGVPWSQLIKKSIKGK